MGMFNPVMETMERSKLMELQLKRLKETVHRVYENVPFYRRKFEELGVKPQDIKSLDDITKLPFTVKNDLRDNYPFGMAAIPLDEAIELHASSGTTGSPITVIYNRHDIDDVWAEIMARDLVMAGLTKKDVFQNPIPYGLFTGAFGFHYGAQKAGALVVPSGGGQSERQLKLMKDYGTTFMSGVASYAVHLGTVAEKMGIDPKRDLRVRTGIFGAEAFSEGIKRRLAEQWDMEVYDIYGLTEMSGPGVATDCENHDGLHIWEDHFIVEIVDPKTGEQLGPEEEGELVLTTITKEGMPIIRYRTHDLTYIYDSKSCDCGRTHARMAPVKARTDDMFIIRGTNIFPSQIEWVLMRNQKVGANYQIILTTEGDMDQLNVLVESKEKLSESESSVLAKELTSQIKAVLTLTPRVKVIGPGEIPKEGIKAKRVIDRRKKI